METGIADMTQRRTAAHLSAIELSEEQRHPAAPKAFRAGIRAARAVAERGGGGEERAEALYGAFPQGAPASHRRLKGLSHATGARALKRPRTGGAEDRRRAAARDLAGGHLSESSDED